MTNTHIPEVAIPSVFPSHHKKCGLIHIPIFLSAVPHKFPSTGRSIADISVVYPAGLIVTVPA